MIIYFSNINITKLGEFYIENRIPPNFLKEVRKYKKVLDYRRSLVAYYILYEYLLFNKIISEFTPVKIFSEILLTVDSMLIGFTGILVTILLTTENRTIDTLKKKESPKKLYGKKVNIFDLLHILFTNSLLNEIILLLVVMLNLFLRGLLYNKILSLLGLIIEVFMILNITFSIMRGVNNLYWTFKKK